MIAAVINLPGAPPGIHVAVRTDDSPIIIVLKLTDSGWAAVSGYHVHKGAEVALPACFFPSQKIVDACDAALQESEELDSIVPGWREMDLADVREAILQWTNETLDLMNDLKRMSQ